MAQLPGYDSSQQMSTQPAQQQRNMAQEQQMGRNIANLGEVARDIATVWQDAENAADTLDRQNFMDEGQREIFDRAEKEPDYKNSKQYYEDMEKVREGSLEGFSSNRAKAKFAITAQNQTAAANIKLDSLFRTKFQDHYKNNIIISRDQNKKDYIRTGDEAYREKHRATVVEAANVGAVNGVFVANESVDVDGWEDLRYLQVAEDGDPQGAIDMVIASDMDPTEKGAAINNIKAIQKQGDVKRELQRYENNVKITQELESYIDNPNMSYVEKLNQIEQAEKFGYPEADAKRLKNNLDRANQGLAESHDEEFATAVEMIGSLQSGLKKPKKSRATGQEVRDALEYMEAVKATKDYIVDANTAGRITLDEKQRLNESLKKTVEPEATTGVTSIGQDRSWWNPGNWLNFSYDDARIQFDKNFNDNKAKTTAAMKRYFYEVDGKKLNAKDRKAKLAEITDIINGEARDATIQKQSEARKPKMLTDAQVLEQAGFTEADVTYSMEQSGKSRADVINHLRGR